MLEKIAEEMRCTSGATARMAERISAAMQLITAGGDGSLVQGATIIREALADIQNVEDRCNLMALAVRQYALLPPGHSHHFHEEIWQSLRLGDPI